MTRRELILSSAALSAAAAAAQSNGSGKTVSIASGNGINATARAVEMMKAGADTLDAVIAGVNINEDDPDEHGVGLGGLPNEEGVVELDASVMHGPTRRCGAVASIQRIKNPSKVAKLVMQETDHVMMAGAGALKLAKAFGFAEDELLTEKSRLAWMVWKKSLRDASGHNNWTDGLDAPVKASAQLKKMFPDVDEKTLAWAWQMAVHPIAGTINCLGLNAKGEISGVTTTSGLAWKIAGRVGDSPIIGAGLYVDQEVGGAGSTGRGEENIRISGGHTIVENMRRGMSPTEACLDACKRVARNYDNDNTRLKAIGITFYALRKDGVYGSANLWKGGQFAVNDGKGPSRLENCAYLLG
ncbi:MAG: N(4)-(beta-N-acetylglucosaminyl)-L-asparaginase [Candidatus Solibacter usitatus]|nr:N(4)-(beta-N-acetylglucosaminyl)-L-asparaginase [Candidatus Solibacter usitatus]